MNQFEYNGDFYLNLDNPNIEKMTPKVEGFIEISGSQFHAALEAKEQLEV